ncbi:SDR family NAD(P)-dependent oxidoreductase [Paenibacillus macerans]|uniref:SDR family NAD(P)-dependent oxidoreductase n=1 Tax=Paenibacillus macerans TaxID=44252 RepID=UPI002E1B2246|nr:SDR family NAD(P)-dependent oxidoreductase [Paenibacillus macerans]
MNMTAINYRALEAQGVYFGQDGRLAANKTVFLFTGHGSQYPNMLKELAGVSPVVGDTLREADEVYERLTGRKLTELIFYEGEENKAQAEKNLAAAEVMQPAIIMANMAMYRLIRPLTGGADIHLGHSLGEIAALAAANVFSFADALTIAYYRARSLNIIDPSLRGTMISLKAARGSAELNAALKGVGDYYTVSLHNAQDQVVVSGTQQAIDKIAANCEAERVAYTRLAVSHAFHSKLLGPAVKAFRKKLLEFTYHPPQVSVYSTILGDFYEPHRFTTDEMASLLSRQLLQPFSFYDIVTRLHETHGGNVFIEVGPKDILTKLVKSILGDTAVYAHAGNVAAAGDLVSLERLTAYLQVHRLGDGSLEKESAAALPSAPKATVSKPAAPQPTLPLSAGPRAFPASKPAFEPAGRRDETAEAVIGIIQYATGYPRETIAVSDRPMKLELALNDKVFQSIIEKLRAQFGLTEDALPLDERISLAAILGRVRIALGEEVVEPTENAEKLPAESVKEFLVESAEKFPVVSPAASAAAIMAPEAVEARVKEIIQAKTGYPVDMLEGELDLEADLGIDSVKQAEIFVQIREAFGYEANPDLNIKQFNTIRKIAEYTVGRLEDMKAGEASLEVAPAAEADLFPSSAPAVSLAEVLAKVKEIIQAKTGYPVDMLEDELDLEADLGIDSVKQAEIFVQIREAFGYEANPDLNIKQFNTIRKIAEYTLDRLEVVPAAAPHAAKEERREWTDEGLREWLRQFSGEQVARRYVPVTVEREYNATAGRAFAFGGKGFIVVEDRLGGEITAKLAEQLALRGAELCVLSAAPEKYGRAGIRTDFGHPELFKQSLEEAKARLNDIHGFIYLYPLTPELSYFDIDEEPWHREVDNSFNLLFQTAKTVYEDVERHGSEAGCFAATNIGGIFGIERETSFNPVGALTAGFFKSMEKELDDFGGKVVDLSDTRDIALTAETLLKEFSLIEPLIEIGYVQGRRKTIQVLPAPIEPDRVAEPLRLGAEDVILVSGGGRGIIFECVKGLAELFRPTIIVTGRTELPRGDEEWLHFSEAEFEQYSTVFFQRMKREHPQLTPIQIKQELEKLKGAAALYRNLQSVKDAGYRFQYYRCDVSDRDDVRRLAADIRSKFGKVTGIVNGAGLPSFGKVPKKPEAHSLNVVRVKANGFFHLYREFADEPLRFFASIGSVSGRFGMDGQVDYAGGADIIVRMSFQLFRKRPELKAFVMGWTAWDEVGMATDPQVQKIQKEQRGLEFIGSREGTRRFLEEIVYGGSSPEVLYYGSLGTNRPLGQMDALDEAGSEVRVHFGARGEVTDRIHYPLLQRVKRSTGEVLEVQKDLTVQEDIYLKDHLVEGKYVFAGVMHVEAFGELGMLMNRIHGADSQLVGTRIHSVEFSKFVKYFEGSPLTLDMKAEVVGRSDSRKEVRTEIRSDFYNRQGQVLEKERLHSSGYAVFERERPAPRTADTDVVRAVHESKPMDIERFYALTDHLISFGPTFRCLDYVGYVNDDVVVGQVTVPDDRRIFSYAAETDMLISPITIDNIGRCMLFNDFHKHGNIIVPRGIGDAVLYRPFKKGETVYVHCRLLRDEGETVDFHAQVVDAENRLIFDMIDLHLIRIAKVHGDHDLF